MSSNYMTDALGRYTVNNGVVTIPNLADQIKNTRNADELTSLPRHNNLDSMVADTLQRAYSDTIARQMAPIFWSGRSRVGSKRDNQRKRHMAARRAGKPSYRQRQARGRAMRKRFDTPRKTV